jgi:hypothetical protein
MQEECTNDFCSTLLHLLLLGFSTVSEDAGIAPRTVATLALAVRRSLTTRSDLIHRRLDLLHIKCAPDLSGQHNSVDPHEANRREKIEGQKSCETVPLMRAGNAGARRRNPRLQMSPFSTNSSAFPLSPISSRPHASGRAGGGGGVHPGTA